MHSPRALAWAGLFPPFRRRLIYRLSAVVSSRYESSLGGTLAHTIENVACTQCGCVCDDLRISVEGGRVVRAERACGLAEPWYLALETQHSPAASIGGGTVPFEAALERAAEIHAGSRAPLIYGLSRSST